MLFVLFVFYQRNTLFLQNNKIQMKLLKLKEILSEKGITNKDFAEKIGVSANTVSNICSGNNFPKPELLLKIAEELKMEVRDLFYSTQDREPIYIQRDGKLINIGEVKLNS